MPVTQPGPTPQPEPAPDDDHLHSMVQRLAEAAFAEPVQVVTTDRTGRVDGGWTPDGAGGLRRVRLHTWLTAAAPEVRDLTLANLGGMLRAYAQVPEGNPLITVKTYEDWPAMVEVHLYE